MTTTDLEKARELAREGFGLELPLTLDRLKAAFRALALELHPDRGNGDSAAFCAMMEAYHFLMSLRHRAPGIFSDADIRLTEKTVEGIPLAELGLGIDPMKNAKDCSDCEHRGYLEKYGQAFKVCEVCDQNGLVPMILTCRACSGLGRFTQRSGRVVTCRVCRGTGEFRHPHRKDSCSECHGSKTIWLDGERVYYERCGACNGAGELEIFNPVIPKGILTDNR